MMCSRPYHYEVNYHFCCKKILIYIILIIESIENINIIREHDSSLDYRVQIDFVVVTNIDSLENVDDNKFVFTEMYSIVVTKLVFITTYCCY